MYKSSRTSLAKKTNRGVLRWHSGAMENLESNISVEIQEPFLYWVVATQICFIITPKIGEYSHFDYSD